MEIIFASTGVDCVAAPTRGVIFLDPTLDYESAVAAIQASMPSVHIDAVRHWVEKAMPSAAPLRRRVRARPARRRMRRFVAATLLVALGASGMWGFDYVNHRYIENVFDDAVFMELARDRGWSCDRGLNHPTHAGCITRSGTVLRVSATTSERLKTFTVTYERNDTPYMNRLLVFPGAQERSHYLSIGQWTPDDGMHPNLMARANWAIYGNDGEKLLEWNAVLPNG